MKKKEIPRLGNTLGELQDLFNKLYPNGGRVAKKQEIQFLDQYFSRQSERHSRVYVLNPSEFIRKLIKKHLNYTFPQ